MTSCIPGSRSRRAAALPLLCAAAIVACVSHISAQEPSNAIDAGDNAVVISDDGPEVMPEGVENGGYPCVDADNGCSPCDNACPCDLGQCESCDDDHCAGWFGAEWLRWHLDGNRLPPLVTEGPSSDPSATVARLGQSDTQILNEKNVNDNWRNGYRLFGGFWLDCCHTVGVGVDYFDVGDDNYNFLSRPNPTEVIGRPFFNTQLGEEDVEFVSVP
ncbi:MAG TPA: BBP7 family outer membrane beta-barrel protein, partial [Lacipirellulaceae bacterium]|nr:BBP7 family outer membrane beta-barrel protein [Lacipirellulaceae bacterium]